MSSQIALLADATSSLATPPARALYAPKEVEQLLNVSHAQLYRLLGRGSLDGRKIGSRTFVTAESIAAFLANLPPAQVRSAS